VCRSPRAVDASCGGSDMPAETAHWSELREFAECEPSALAFRALVALLDTWPGDDQAAAIEYAGTFLSTWPDAVRLAPWSWCKAVSSSPFEPFLANIIKADETAANAVPSCPAGEACAHRLQGRLLGTRGTWAGWAERADRRWPATAPQAPAA